jgi:Fur family peroxide stress response transcriptional regulator
MALMGRSTPNAEIGRLLKRHGLRVTPQRVAICGQLLARHRHVTPQELHEALKGRFPSLSPNTVYLTLSQLESVGLVRRLHVEGQSVFDSNTGPHDHAYCERCGRLEDLPPEQPPGPPPAVGDWRIERASRTLSGLCPACRQAGAA